MTSPSQARVLSPSLRAVALALAGALSLPAATASAAPAAASSKKSAPEQGETSSPKRTVEITVQTSELGAEFEDLSGRIVEVARAAVNMLDATPSNVEVRVRWLDPDAFRYQIIVTLDSAQERIEPVTVERECDGCTQKEVIAASVTALKDAAESLEERSVETAEAAPAQAPPPRPTTAPETASSGGDKATRLGPLGWSGVPLLTLGVGAAATGIAFLVIDKGPIDDRPTQLRDYRPAGIALTAAGGVGVLLGAIFLGVDRPRTARRVAATPVFGRSTAGMTLQGRF